MFFEKRKKNMKIYFVFMLLEKKKKKRELKRENLAPCQKPLHVKFKKWHG